MEFSLSLSSLREQYTGGNLQPRELVAKLLKRASEIDNPYVWIHLFGLNELEPYFRRLENLDPIDLPLYGVPFAIKDNIDLAGSVTTAGCAAYAYFAEKTAPVVQQLIDAGAIPLGKTNLDQFATGLVGVRSPYGIPRNPIAPSRVPGGSSAGSAVAVSEGLVSFALGTDTAGSGRIPALFNKIWGIKPSCGRLSTRGVVPACRSLDCVSIFSKSAADGMKVLKVAEGYDPHDPYSKKTHNATLPVEGKIGVPGREDLFFFGDADYEISWDRALQDYESKGWEIVDIDFKPFLEAARFLYDGPWVAERTVALKGFMIEHAEDVYPVTRLILNGGHEHSACDLFDAEHRMAVLKRKAHHILGSVSAIITPTAGGFPSLADLADDPIGPNSQLGYYTNFMNLLDLCAVAAPLPDADSGLPFGVTWFAPRGRDLALLEAADSRRPTQCENSTLSLVLFGAHMSGLPLNAQIESLGGEFIGEVQTASAYKMLFLSDTDSSRPGVVRVTEGGTSISGEEWVIPMSAVGELLHSIDQPLGLGIISLSDGRLIHGFLCESTALETMPDISEFRGWREFLASLEHK
jgi:allophanate hydrolase